MKTLDEWMQEHGEEYIDNIKKDIENLNLPTSVQNSIEEIIEENEFDIIEEKYNEELSSYEDMKYQEYKERDI